MVIFSSHTFVAITTCIYTVMPFLCGRVFVLNPVHVDIGKKHQGVW
jgi:hypothetical protein